MARDPILSRTIQKQLFVSPLTAHFLATTAKKLGIPQTELTRRIIDAALFDYMRTGIYELPEEWRALPCAPLPVPKIHKWTPKSNGKANAKTAPQKTVAEPANDAEKIRD